MEFRCDSRIHAVVKDGLLEIKCHSKRCGKVPGVAVFHYFDPLDGRLVKTKKFKSPEALFTRKQEVGACP